MPNQSDLPGRATMTLEVDFDNEAVQSFMKEGHTDVADLLNYVAANLKDKAAFMKGDPMSNAILNQNMSFKVVYKVKMLDDAFDGYEDKSPPKGKNRITLLMEDN